MEISPQRAGELMFLADPGRVIGGLAVGLRDAAILALVAAGLSGGEIERLRADAVRTIHGRVVVMAILGVVLSGLTTVFVGGSTAEPHLNHRFQTQQEARAALDRIRTDIHCASSAQALAFVVLRRSQTISVKYLSCSSSCSS